MRKILVADQAFDAQASAWRRAAVAQSVRASGEQIGRTRHHAGDAAYFRTGWHLIEIQAGGDTSGFALRGLRYAADRRELFPLYRILPQARPCEMRTDRHRSAADRLGIPPILASLATARVCLARCCRSQRNALRRCAMRWPRPGLSSSKRCRAAPAAQGQHRASQELRESLALGTPHAGSIALTVASNVVREVV